MILLLETKSTVDS